MRNIAQLQFWGSLIVSSLSVILIINGNIHINEREKSGTVLVYMAYIFWSVNFVINKFRELSFNHKIKRVQRKTRRELKIEKLQKKIDDINKRKEEARKEAEIINGMKNTEKTREQKIAERKEKHRRWLSEREHQVRKKPEMVVRVKDPQKVGAQKTTPKKSEVKYKLPSKCEVTRNHPKWKSDCNSKVEKQCRRCKRFLCYFHYYGERDPFPKLRKIPRHSDPSRCYTCQDTADF